MKQFPESFKPLKIGSVTIKNRYCMAPMLLASCYGHNGQYTEQGMKFYEARAKGGFGLIFTGGAWADAEIDPFSDRKVIYTPSYSPSVFMASARTLNERVEACGSKIFAQYSMGLGRNIIGMHAPSEVPYFFAPDQMAPALTKEQIKRKVEIMVETGALMKNSGFAGVEIHALHWGYLLDLFALSLTNKRKDEYGGTLENRLRVCKEIVQGIKQVCGADYPVTIRLGIKSFLKGYKKASLTGEEEVGRTIEEAVRIAQLFEEYGYDALNVDAGMYDSFYYGLAPMYVPKGYIIDLASQVKQAVNIPVLTCSRMDDPDMSEEALRSGKTDAIVLGRSSLADPDYPKKLEMGIPEKIRPCIACNQGCLGKAFSGGEISCAVNPMVGRELSFGIDKAIIPKKVAVVGGGISGMEMARTAKLRGHDVVLYEKTSELGGNLIPGGRHEFKRDMNRLNEWYQQDLRQLDVPIHMNTELNSEQVKELDVDVVVLSVGSSPVMPNIPGIDDKKVISTIDALLEEKEIGDKVVVVGGGLVGCEMAYDYARKGKTVTVVEALDSILSAGPTVPLMNGMMIRDLFEHFKVEIVAGHRLQSISEKGVMVAPANGEGDAREIEADSIVIAVGYKPLPSMARDLFGQGVEVYEIGDGNRVGNVQTSILDAYSIARLL